MKKWPATLSMDTSKDSKQRIFKWAVPLAEDAYLRQRLTPSLFAIDYLPFRDLLATVEHFARHASGAVFDYGCGGSPYRHVFSHCDRYIGADIVPGPKVDVVLKSDGHTQQPNSSFHTVLSSQVLEHVTDPHAYLTEAHRILAPGGILILTTHGMFLEHGCPDDYYRWTGYGLSAAARKAGFEVLETVKITPGVRASAHLIHTAIFNCRVARSRPLQAMLGVLRRAYAGSLRGMINLIASWLEPHPYLPATHPAPLYIGVGILARKPVS